MDFFSKNKTSNETCIAPRPKPGTFQSHYFATFKLEEGTVNAEYFSKLKSFAKLSQNDYESEIGTVEFFWEV